MAKRLKLLVISISSLFLACQTTKAKKDQVGLESEKGIIVSYLNSGEHPLALRSLRKSLAKYPKDAELLNLMGLVQLSLKNYPKALEFFEQSYQQEPKALVLLNMSSVHIEMGQHKQARQILARLARDESPGSYNAKERVYHNLGYSYQSTNSLDNAAKFYKKAIAENPTYHMSWLQLGRVYQKTNNAKKETEALKKAVGFCPLCMEPNEALFHAYLRQKDYQNARNLMSKLITNDEISPRSKKRATDLLRRVQPKK